MWRKFGNSSISVREVIITSILYKDLTRKNTFFEGWSWFKFNNLGLTLGIILKFYTSVAKWSKLKVRKFWGLVSTFVKVIVEKLLGGGGAFLPLPLSWIGLNKNRSMYKHTCHKCLACISQTSLVHTFPEVWNSRVTKWSYETELRNMTSHFELLTRKCL